MFTTLALAAALAAPVPKTTAADLKWKFAKGDTFYVTSDVENTASVVAGGPGVAAQANTSAARFVYKAVVTTAGDKETTVELEFLSASNGTGVAGAAAKLADTPGVAGKKVTFTLDKDHKVTRSVGADTLPNVGGGILGNDYLKHNVEDLIRAVPGKPLAKGGTWTGEQESPLADGVVYKRADRGTVTGTEDGLVKLEVETDNVMTGGPKGGGVVFDLKGDKGKRTVLFDGKAGRVRKVSEEYAVAGTIGLGGGGGGGQNLQLSITMKATVSVSDTEPKDGK
jgi:hypothetical protein